MNRIFKTVWNVARRALVVVNEKAGIGQSRCATVGAGCEASTSSSAVSVEHRQSFGVPSAVCLALTGVLVFWGGNAEAAKTFPTDCASVGGTIKDGVCYVGDGTQDDPVVDTVNDEWILTQGDMQIQGNGGNSFESCAIEFNASNGGKSTISNAGTGTLTITGGSGSLGPATAPAMVHNASGSGSIGTISNTSTGNLCIRGGGGGADSANGITYNADNGGTGTISNVDSGTLIIMGGEWIDTFGIVYNAYGEGSTGTISNKGGGTLTIMGSAYTAGVGYNAFGSGSNGTITNDGEGILTISGGNGSECGFQSRGLEYNASDGGTGTISNTGSGELVITAGTGASGLSSNAHEGIGTISNTGSGTLSIMGGNGEFDYTCGIGNNAVDGTGLITNDGTGKLIITGGTGPNASGIRTNSDSALFTNENTKGTISNTGEGSLVISGGTGKNADGLYINANYGVGRIANEGKGSLLIQGSNSSCASGTFFNALFEGTGSISNTGEGNLSIVGGEYLDASGLKYNASYGGTGTISNSGAGTLKITAGSGEDAYGVGFNAYSENGDVTTTGLIINEGTGTLQILGGSGKDSFGLSRNATGLNATGEIKNTGAGDILIQGGSANNANGVGFNAHNDGHGTIRNAGTGELTIQGGSFERATGVKYNAHGTESEGTVANEGSGTLSILGGQVASAYGIETIASNGGTGTVENTGDGVLTISNGVAEGISTGATGADSTARFVNSGSGDMLIRGAEDGTDGIFALYFGSTDGGEVSFENSNDGDIRFQSGAHGNSVWFLANTGGTATISNTGKGSIVAESLHYHNNGIWYLTWIGGKTTVSNTGGGLIAFKGGEFEQSNGLHSSAYGEGTVVDFINDASTFLIQGGTGEYAVGIAHGSGDGSAFNITNRNGGVFTFQGGDNVSSHALNNAIDRSGTFTVKNEAGATMNIMGVAGKSNGIANLVAVGGDASIENAGTLNMNASAIGTFINGATNPATASFTNKATGTVHAEAEAIFAKTENSVASPIDIGLITSSGGTWDENKTQLSSFQGTTQTWDWALKDDWTNYSHWEDGGQLMITDIMDGSYSAQQITAAFQEKFGTGTTLTFLGENDDASEGMAPKFSASIANDLIAQGHAGAIVTNFDLDVSSDDGTKQHVTVGQNGANDISDSIGFRKIKGASAVSVRGGKTLTLIGTIEGEELVEGGGKVDLNNGKLQLGVDAGTAETTGVLSDVTIVNDSKVTAENGWFRMDSLTGTGNVSVAENGRVYAGNMTVRGNVKNAGTLSADSLTVKGSMESTKTLKSSGTITVDSSSKLVANGAVVADKLDVKGVMIRGNNANVYTGAAAMDLLRRDDADAAAEIDRVEGKAGINTMSVLDRIVAQSMKKFESEETDSVQKADEGADSDSSEESSKKKGSSATASTTSSGNAVVKQHRRAAPVLPQDAQAFAAFDAVNRIASDIERGSNADGHGLWVKLLTGESEFGVREGAKFEVDSDGAMIGAEAKLTPNFKFGAAFSYLDGEIDAGRLKNDWTSYGMHAYLSYREGDFGVKGTVGWLRGTTEAERDYDADVWHAGVRTEYDLFKGERISLTPFLGARVMGGSFDGMDSQTVVNVPVGLKLAGQLTTAGWTVTPALEASYVRSMGDTEAKDVRFLPENAFAGALSLKAEKGAWTGELSFRGAAGSDDYEDRAFMAKVGVKF